MDFVYLCGGCFDVAFIFSHRTDIITECPGCGAEMDFYQQDPDVRTDDYDVSEYGAEDVYEFVGDVQKTVSAADYE